MRRRDMGTRGHGDTGTRGHGDTGTRGYGHTCAHMCAQMCTHVHICAHLRKRGGGSDSASEWVGGT